MSPSVYVYEGTDPAFVYAAECSIRRDLEGRQLLIIDGVSVAECSKPGPLAAWAIEQGARVVWADEEGDI